ncbi:MAG: hypothetical protein ABJB01_00965 [Rudaea sp.]
MKRILGTVIALALGAPVVALANEAYIVGDISLQSGPDSEYPPILDLQAGTPVDVQGCIEGFSWCDVIVGNERGWVPGSYVEEEYDRQPVYLIDYGPRIGVPIVSFSIGTYWDRHYHNRPFYSQRNVWVERHFQPRPPPRPSFAHAPPIPNRGGHGPDNHGPTNHGPDNHGHAAPANNAPPPQRAVTQHTAPRPEQNAQRAAVRNGNQHAPVATTHTETVKRTTTTTERVVKPAPQRAQTAAQPKPQVERMPPKPQQTPRAQPHANPKEQPKPPEHKEDDHGH